MNKDQLWIQSATTNSDTNQIIVTMNSYTLKVNECLTCLYQIVISPPAVAFQLKTSAGYVTKDDHVIPFAIILLSLILLSFTSV